MLPLPPCIPVLLPVVRPCHNVPALCWYKSIHGCTIMLAVKVQMQRSNVAAGSESSPAPGSSGANALGEPRLSGGLSFREVGDWFKNLGDDLGSMVGIPRSRFSSRRSPGSAPHRFDTVSGGSVSSGSALGTVLRLPSTSLLAKKQQVRHAWCFLSDTVHWR